MIPPMPLSYDLVKNAKYSPLLLFSAMFLKHQNETAPQRPRQHLFQPGKAGQMVPVLELRINPDH
jgi:hypothetical protein